MNTNTTHPSLCAHVTQDSNAPSGDPNDRPAKKPYTRPRLHQLDDVAEKTEVLSYTPNGASVCSVNGS
jgi:hypothetical protein